MDKRDMEDEGKDREGKRWAIGIKKVIFGNFRIDILGLVIMFM
jgi:hypothetical protein